LGINSPVDLADWIQRAGLQFSFEGHPGLPQVKLDFETKNMEHHVPDNAFEEDLRKMTIMAMGLPPETVDNGFNAEFATTIVQNNILLSKQINQLQNKFTVQNTDCIQKILRNDMTAFQEMLEILKKDFALMDKFLDDEDKELDAKNHDHFLETLVYRFIDNIFVDLPRPDITTVANLKEAYDSYSTALDSALQDAFMNGEIMNEAVNGEAATHLDSLRGVVKAFFLRRWMSTNNFLPELAELISKDEEGKPMLNIYDLSEEHNSSLIRSLIGFIEKSLPMKLAADKDLKKMGTGEGELSSSGSGNDDEGGSGGFGNDFGGFETGFGGGNEGGGDNLTPPENPEEPEKTPEQTPEGGTPPAE
jgi:hypothetical protein